MQARKLLSLCILATLVSSCSDAKEPTVKTELASENGNAQYCTVGSEALTLDIGNITLERVSDIPLNYEGFNNVEGPVWHDGALYYSNIGALAPDENGFVLSNQTTIWRWQPGQAPKVWLDDTIAGTNGLAVDFNGNLIAVRHSDGSVSKIDWQSKEVELIAGEYEDKRFNSPNDLTVAFDGTIYFTDPNWDTPSNVDRAITQGGGAPGTEEVGQRIYRVNPEGQLNATAATELVPALRDKPNGIMLSLNQNRLFVAGLKGLWSFTLDHGHLSNPKQILTTAVDGMGKDCAGNLYVTTTRELAERKDGQVVVVLDRNDAEVGQIEVPGIHIVTNVAFGGDDGKTLFITALTDPMDGDVPRMCGAKECLRAGIYTALVNVPGFPN
ncbi:MAG: gluconolactonase [Flavobacteriales bacterium]|jgi:gluconolactonase